MKALYKHKTLGHVVEVCDTFKNELGGFYVKFHAQGGGIERGCTLPTFMKEYAPYEPSKVMSKIEVCGDWMDPGTYYKAWSDGSRWNGWLIPYFERDEVQRMSEDGVSLIGFVHDQVLIERDESTDVSINPVTIETPEGPKQVWQIDDGWCWEIYEPEDY